MGWNTFRRQIIQNTPTPDHYNPGPLWKLRCRKSARRCDAKYISKLKWVKYTSSGSFFEISKKLRRCGAKYISKLKFTKQTRFGLLLEDKMSNKYTQLWHEVRFEIKIYKIYYSRFWKLRCQKKKNISKSKYSKPQGFGPLFDVQIVSRGRQNIRNSPPPPPHPPPPPCSPDPSGHSRTSTASSRSQWAQPDLHRELQIPVGTTGP